MNAREPIAQYIDANAAPQSIIDTQRTLRFLGYYRGRTNGAYDDTTKAAIFAFQKANGLVGDWESNGAGRIGPVTSKALLAEWNRKVVTAHAEDYLDLHTIDTTLAEKGTRIEQFLGDGYYGKQVRLLQNQLVALGFFPKEKVNGSYGPLTRDAVMQYQFDRGIVSSQGDKGAGYVGPSTLYSLRKDQRSILYKQVRAEGWKAI
jgi:peptidoglycan hydrolase-like protein with peptidoglycan-binding domain